MREGGLAPFGTGGGIVEIDETFIGNDREIKPKGEKKGGGYAHRHKVLSLIDRNTGRQRSMVVDSLKAADLLPVIKANIAAEDVVMTDEAAQHKNLSASFTEHGITHHSAGQYVDYENPTIHTNTIEGAFSIFKRGMKGVYPPLYARAGFAGRHVPHGWRASFSTICRELLGDDWRDDIERALAHRVKDKTEGAYNRAQQIGRRHDLFTRWGALLAG